MSFVAAAIGGAAVLGAGASMLAADKQSKAASAGADAIGKAGAMARSDLTPWRTSGTLANNDLMMRLGLTPKSGPDWDAYLKMYPDVAASATFASDPAAHYEQYGRKEGRTVPVLSGSPSTNPNFGSLVKPFTMTDLTSEPGYQFGLSEGEKGIGRATAAGSGRYSGATLKALTRFNEDYAGTKYDAAFNRDASTKNQTYNFLMGESNLGENASAQTGANAMNTATGVANANAAGANAGAAGVVGVANAASSGAGSYINYNQQQKYLDMLQRGGGTGTVPYTIGGNI